MNGRCCRDGEALGIRVRSEIGEEESVECVARVERSPLYRVVSTPDQCE